MHKLGYMIAIAVALIIGGPAGTWAQETTVPVPAATCKKENLVQSDIADAKANGYKVVKLTAPQAAKLEILAVENGIPPVASYDYAYITLTETESLANYVKGDCVIQFFGFPVDVIPAVVGQDS